MSKGVLLFARNNEEVDYVKQAYFLARRVKEYLNLPTTVVTDSPDYLENAFPDYQDFFDKVIRIVWRQEDVGKDSVLVDLDAHTVKTFCDGSITTKRLFWKNRSRTLAYQVTPYDETLVLDTDVVIGNDVFLRCFEQPNDLLMYKRCCDIAGIDRGHEFTWVSETSVDFYWATCIFFRKTPVNETFFNLVRHIQENWLHYSSVFQLRTSVYRNDFAFSIATHIMNGYQSSNFVGPMPGTLYYTTDKSILWSINGSSLFFLLEKPEYVGEYTALRVNGSNVHVMNKFSLGRCIDEQ